MKYSDVFTDTEPKLQLGQIVGSEQGGRIHELQARLVASDGTPVREGTIKTFIPVAEIEILDKDGYADPKYNRLSSNGKWLVKPGVQMADFAGLSAK